MPSDDVRARFEKHVHPLSRVEPPADGSTTEDDLAALDDVVAGAAIVGLGEATHGTCECHTLRHRAVSRLATVHGFRTVALEADPGRVRALDRYVRHGDGTAAGSLATVDRWTWHAESLIALFEWLRAFNVDRPPADRVRVHGVEPGDPTVPAARVREFFEAVDPTFADGADEFDLLVDHDLQGYDDEEATAQIELALDALDAVETRLNEDAASYEAARSREAVEIARYLVDCARQAYEFHRLTRDHGDVTEQTHAERERMTAANVARCAEMDAGDGTVHLAHDGHVQRGTTDGPYDSSDARTRGSRLEARFDDEYRVVGFEFARGALTAIDLGDDDRPLRTVEVDEPVGGSLPAVLDAVADGPALLDVGSMAESSSGDWFAQPRRTRAIGAVFDPTAPADRHYIHTDIPHSFDALFFVPESTPTTRTTENA